MNNNQDNLNINPQMNNINNTNNTPNPNTFFNNQNNFVRNTQEPINVIPQNEAINIQNNLNQGFEQTQNLNIAPNPIQNQNNSFFNNNVNTNIDNNVTKEYVLNDDGITAFQEQNRFINNNENHTNTALNDLNIIGEYNGMPKVDYSQEPKVRENINQQQKKKNTITITGETKVFLIIIAVLLLFTFIMPYIFDAIRNIQY